MNHLNETEQYDDLSKISKVMKCDNLIDNLNRIELDVIELYLNGNASKSLENIEKLKNFFLTNRAKNNDKINYEELEILDMGISYCYDCNLIEKYGINSDWSRSIVLKDETSYYSDNSDNSVIIDIGDNSDHSDVDDNDHSDLNQDFNDRNTINTNKKSSHSLLDSILNNDNSYTVFKNELTQSDSSIVLIPDEILEIILLESFYTNTRSINILEFYNIRYVCKRFYRIVHNNSFLDKLISPSSYYIKNCLINRFKNLDLIKFDTFSKIIYKYLYLIFKQFIIDEYGPQLILALGGYNKFINLPFTRIDSYCLDNLCSNNCSKLDHIIYNNINSPITRGMDTSGRPFVLIIYKIDKIKKPIYEFIYNNKKPDNYNITFSGMGGNTFIGNKSVNYSNYNSVSYRTLNYKSYDYINRLVQNKPTGTVYFKNISPVAVENLDESVSLHYNRELYINALKTRLINNE